MEPIREAFHRLLRFGHAAKERALPVWKSTQLRSEPARRWLNFQFEPALQWLKLRPRATGIALVLILGFVVGGGPSWYGKHHAALAPLLTLAAGVSVAAVALIRHFAQTDADRQRRITESFSKAVEQLGSDKLEVRLGGIYSLERISKESPDDYWTVMENLTAYVRERTQRTEAKRDQRIRAIAHSLWKEAGKPEGRSEEFWHAAVNRETSGEPPADIAAVLTVIKRRSETHRAREIRDQRVLDFRRAVLRGADLTGAHLEGADLTFVHLEGAFCREDDAGLKQACLEGAKSWDAYFERMGAHLERAKLVGAHLERAYLGGSHLEGAICIGAHLEGANLLWAHLEGADLTFAHLEYAHLSVAHFDGASQIWAAEGLTQAQIDQARGDAATALPPGLTRPAHWTNPDGGEGSAPAA